MCERAGQLVRIGVLSVLVIVTSRVEHDTVVLAQRGNALGNAVSTGELLIEPPTLINLGFEWFIQGDDSRSITRQLRELQKQFDLKSLY